ncbi:MAG: rhomboid family intramembrane serine protease [Muribaculaceae bacterium]
MGIIEEIKNRYRSGSLLIKLIFINAGIFLAVKLSVFVLMLVGIDASVVMDIVELPSAWEAVTMRPWTLVTYMFMHGDLMHIFFNMLCLYWMGVVFMEFNTPKQLVALYVLSGLMGAAFYLMAYNLLPGFAGASSGLVGASASVLGVLVSACMRAPNYRINLLFIGSVALKWVAIVMVVLGVISFDGNNLGGHIAHAGGAVMGVIYALLLRCGFDITKGINRLIDRISDLFERHPKPMGEPVQGGRYHYGKSESDNASKSTKSSTKSDSDDLRSQYVTKEQAEVDAILEKIKVSGYASLSQEEKKRIFTVGKKN